MGLLIHKPDWELSKRKHKICVELCKIQIICQNNLTVKRRVLLKVHQQKATILYNVW